MRKRSSSGIRRAVFSLAAAILISQGALPAQADTNLKLVLPWDFESGTAPWPVAAGDGCFAKAGLNVTIDRGFGTGDALTKVASNAYDIGVADFGSLVDFDSQHPDQRLEATFVTLDRGPHSVVVLKKSGISKPSDLVGKKIGDAVGEASRAMFPAFAKANGFKPDSVSWVSVTTNLREAALLRGEFDAAAGDNYTIVTNLHRLGIKDSDIRVMTFADNGLDLIGRTVVVKPAWAAAHPDVLKKFLACTAVGIRLTVADPLAAINAVTHYNSLLDVPSGVEGLAYLNRVAVVTTYTKRKGIGDVDPARLQRNITAVSDVFGIPETAVNQVWTSEYLPPPTDRRLTAK
jgi:NitT/TauT family transport system substrate-binding protein